MADTCAQCLALSTHTVVDPNGTSVDLCADHALVRATNFGGRVIAYGSKPAEIEIVPIDTGEDGYYCPYCEEVHRTDTDLKEVTLWRTAGDDIYLSDGEYAATEVTAIKCYRCPDGGVFAVDDSDFIRGRIWACPECKNEYAVKEEAVKCCGYIIRSRGASS